MDCFLWIHRNRSITLRRRLPFLRRRRTPIVALESIAQSSGRYPSVRQRPCNPPGRASGSLFPMPTARQLPHPNRARVRFFALHHGPIHFGLPSQSQSIQISAAPSKPATLLLFRNAPRSSACFNSLSWKRQKTRRACKPGFGFARRKKLVRSCCAIGLRVARAGRLRSHPGRNIRRLERGRCGHGWDTWRAGGSGA